MKAQLLGTAALSGVRRALNPTLSRNVAHATQAIAAWDTADHVAKVMRHRKRYTYSVHSVPGATPGIYEDYLRRSLDVTLIPG